MPPSPVYQRQADPRPLQVLALQPPALMRHAALVLALLAVTACTSEASKQHKAAQTAASWAAASDMALRQWSDGRTTAPFTRKTLERADQDLAAARQDVPSYAAAAVDAARAELAAAQRDIEHDDRNGGRQRAGALAGIAAQLRHAANEDEP